MHVVLAGGGTAGHIEPALAVADALRRLAPDTVVTALGTARGLETRLVPARGYPLELIPAVPLPRSLRPGLVAVPARLLAAVRAAGAVLDRVGADVVVGFGGYVALPAYLAARRRRLPLVVHEANARPGLANRLAARLTTEVAVASPAVRLPHARSVGIPLRPEIAELDRAAEHDVAAGAFGLDPARPVLLVFGGSQGARRINTAAVAAAGALLGAGVQVLHVTGPANVETVRAALPVPPPTGYAVVAYVDGMQRAYAAADAVLCRAGAITCAELATVGLPAAYVPLPIGNGEQALNAAPVVRAGGGLLVRDADLDAGWITARLLPLLRDRGALAAMSVAAAAHSSRGADVAVARMVLAAAATTTTAATGHRRRPVS